MDMTRSMSRASHPVLVAHAEERAKNIQNRLADGITALAGSMWFVYIHVALFAWWLLTDGLPFDDPFPYGLLTMLVSLEAIFLSTFVMISQNRADARRQALAAHEWQMVQDEEQQNEQLLAISRELLELTTAVHGLTKDIHHAVGGAREQP